MKVRNLQNLPALRYLVLMYYFYIYVHVRAIATTEDTSLILHNML